MPIRVFAAMPLPRCHWNGSGQRRIYAKNQPGGYAAGGKGMGIFDRPGQGEEIAEVAVFLASDSSSYINGQAIAVDGSWTCY